MVARVRILFRRGVEETPVAQRLDFEWRVKES